MKLLRLMMLCAVLGGAGFAAPGYAESPPDVMYNKHLAKLLGTWTSADGEVTFNENRTIIYRGKKYFCAVAQGTIQISKRKLIIILPYRFLEGKLLITDGDIVTTYTRVP
ncbi:MAG: hypothetical protein WCD45_00180 [Gallionella sp.]